jgi:hypothetical protein
LFSRQSLSAPVQRQQLGRDNQPSPVSSNIAKQVVEHRLMRRAWTFATGWSRHDVSQQTCAVRTCWVVKSAFLAVNAFETACATPVAFDRATTWLGAAYRLNSQVILRGAVSTVFANPQVIGYGGELGVNVSF